MRKRVLAISSLALIPLFLSGCNMNQKYMSATTATNSADTGKFKTVTVTNDRDQKTVYHNVTVYPYNNGGNDSTGGRLEVRHNGTVTVVPNNAQVDLRK
ncbi:hypothetical protein [Limosilactobacillus vaginalis]|uniref:hypothetical protein n=1 Tax=Limosilactobacillus vaginalis TaxID=1633 RepID=UPI00242ACCCD|nr:hypothetical protein [Limosilactobacillus vaginalis]